MSDVLMYVCPMKRPGGTPKNCGLCRGVRSDMSGECDCCGMQLVPFVPEKEPQTITVSGGLPAALKTEKCARCGYQKWKFWGRAVDGADVWGQCECAVAVGRFKVAECSIDNTNGGGGRQTLDKPLSSQEGESTLVGGAQASSPHLAATLMQDGEPSEGAQTLRGQPMAVNPAQYNVAGAEGPVSSTTLSSVCDHKHTETVADAVVIRCTGCGHEEIRKQSSVKT